VPKLRLEILGFWCFEIRKEVVWPVWLPVESVEVFRRDFVGWM